MISLPALTRSVATTTLAPMQRPVTTFRTLLALGLALLGMALTGCHLVQTVLNLPAHAVHAVAPAKQGPDPVAVQQALIRFTDEFMARMVVGIDGLSLHTARTPLGLGRGASNGR